jgi:hypothetical protein
LGKGERSRAEAKADDLSRREKEDRSGSAGTVGEAESGEEGGVKYFTRITRYFGGGLFL